MKIGAGLAATEKDQVPLLLDALDGLEKLAAEESETRPVSLVLDEFQRVVAEGGRRRRGRSGPPSSNIATSDMCSRARTRAC